VLVLTIECTKLVDWTSPNLQHVSARHRCYH